jgi:hypothetical protein
MTVLKKEERRGGRGEKVSFFFSFSFFLIGNRENLLVKRCLSVHKT